MNKSQIDSVRDCCAEQVRGPGKFQGEPIYSPYFYDCLGNGEGEPATDDDDDSCYRVTVTNDDRRIFPELANAELVICREDDNGFFYCTPEVSE